MSGCSATPVDCPRGNPLAAFSRRARLAVATALLLVPPAHAACPIELAVYTDRDAVASIDFRPTDGAAAVTNRFSMSVGQVVFDGMVMWSREVERPNGVLTRDCPQGDVTGTEYEACTSWQGVIYTADDAGVIGLLPAQGSDAPQHLIVTDLAYALGAWAAKTRIAFARLPWDVFSLSGCQE